jgi:P4 family phage/plasmid primase-like protien
MSILADFPDVLHTLAPRFIFHKNKVPIDYNTGMKIDHQDGRYHHSLTTALVHAPNCAIGWSIEPHFVVMDGDDVILQSGELMAWFITVLSLVGKTYAEISPSGAGVHLLGRLTPEAWVLLQKQEKTYFMPKNPDTNKITKLEFLREGFYSTITGDVLIQSDEIVVIDEAKMRALLSYVKRTQIPLRDLSDKDTELKFETGKLTDDEFAGKLVEWRQMIIEGTTFNPPMFGIAWQSLKRGVSADAVEAELYNLFNQCTEQDKPTWATNRKKIPSLIKRCVAEVEKFRDKLLDQDGSATLFTDKGVVRRLIFPELWKMTFIEKLGWYQHTGVYYKPVSREVANVTLSDISTDGLKIAIADEPNGDVAIELVKRVTKLSNHDGMNKLRLVTEGACIDYMTHTDINDYDSNKHLLNTPAFTVDLTSGAYRDHALEDRFTRVTAIAPKDEPTPIWDKFVADIWSNDSDLIEYCLSMIGYFLTGETSLDVFFVWYGEGGNGKSTLINVLGAILGHTDVQGYFGALPREALIENRNSSYKDIAEHTAQLPGARIAKCSELGADRLNVERIKDITGGEPIKGRALHKNPFSFRPHFKLLATTNKPPNYQEIDPAIIRRLVPIPFLASWTNTEGEAGERGVPDTELGRKLEKELPGIMHQLVGYAKRFYASNRRLPHLPEKATTLGQSFQANVSPFGEYCAEHIVRDQEGRLASSALLGHYRAWHNQSVGGKCNMTPLLLAKEVRRVLQIEATTIRPGKEESSKNAPARGYKGISLIYPNAYRSDDDYKVKF